MHNPNRMRFNFDGREYSIKFRYDSVEDKKKGKYRILTTAIINPINGGVPKVGFSDCSPKDQFCKETGRLLALMRAATPDGVAFTDVVLRAYNNRKAAAHCAA